MSLWRHIGAVALLSLLGCGGPRPEQGASCTAAPQSPVALLSPAGEAALVPQAVPPPQAAPPPQPAPLAPTRRVAATEWGSSNLEVDPRNETFIRDLLDSIDHGSGPYQVLALSAGGQWGAYGVGVLAGMSAANAVPAFSLVTGISTGAMLAPLMFLGDYTAARDLYANLTNDDVFQVRSTPALLRANSLADTAPLRAKVAAIITQDFVDRIARESTERHRVLAVQSVDLDAGASVIFDLTAIATNQYRPCGDAVSPRDCILHAVMAAAAIPVAFPPEFINGDMYVDGGLRQHAFSLKVTQATLRHPNTWRSHFSHGGRLPVLVPNAAPEPTARPIALTMIANTDFVVSPQCVGNGFLTIAERSAGVALDQLSIGSFYRVMSETLEQPGDTARFTYADPTLTKCTQTTSSSSQSVIDAFDKAYIRCLYKSACTLAAGGASIWHTTPDDLPQSPTVGVPVRAAGVAPLALTGPPAICEVASQ